MKKITYEEFLNRQKKNKKSKSKYKNKKMWFDGYVFHSIGEGNRYKKLKFLENSGQIQSLELQPKFLVSDTFYVLKNGVKECLKKHTYSADFKYIEDGKLVIEDYKGMETDVYKNNRKYFLANCEYDIFREYKSARKIINYTKIEEI